MLTRRSFLHSSAALAFAARAGAARADSPGVTNAQIKIGQTMPYSGLASAYGVIGRTEAAYFKMINDEGGVNGRKINLISLDDGYSPSKTVEQVRRLVEQEEVAFLFNTLGTPSNAAIRQYCNDNKIPQLFVASGAAMFSDPKRFPWTIGYNPSYQTEARIYARHILDTKPGAKIAVLYQNDGFGKDYLIGLKEGLADKADAMIVRQASYETTEPTVDSQVVALQGSGADVFLIAASPKFAAQAIRRAYDLAWSATRYLSIVSVSITSVLKPAGLDKSKGLITAYYAKDSTDPRWSDDAGMREWGAFCAKYLSQTEFIDSNAVYGYGAAGAMTQVLKQCGDDLSRENVMRQAANLKDLQLPLLLPGMRINTSPTNYSPIRQMQLAKFDGQSWQLFGELLAD